ncbi:response regulator [Algibacillus agarilyticus]|uniref:response regulator n=1 Tax=Algibacillus agarilyticus TaxID=2234133 RepID=UPI000DD07204|nr:response regulator [Algibacillus agarilyticus]
MIISNVYSILIIDDETANLKVLSSLLKDDYRVIAVKSGAIGIEKAQALQPDLILLDVVMPALNGFEVIQRLKQISTTSHIPVVFITGLNSPEDEETGLTLGAVDYIYKPFSPSVVRARVATQIKIIQQKRELTGLSDELKIAADIKARFLANMSHEIRTPLTTIIGYTDSLLKGEVPENQRLNAIEAVANSGQHLLGVVNDILDFSKIEANQLEIEHITVNLFELLHHVYQMGLALAQNKPLKIAFVLATKLPCLIKTDPTRLKQILFNLLSNAIKFTESGEVSLIIRREASQLVFAVKDTGIGIAPDKIGSLFGAFHQVETSTTRKYGGSGLGLSISKNLSEKLGGDITVQSELNQGSCFTLSIALDIAPNSRWTTQYDFNQVTEIDINKEEYEKNPILGRVLLAEDHDENRQLFCLILESLGLQVDAVCNGEEAVESCLLNDYQLVLMDIQMPILDGLSAFELLKQSGFETPVIALTANVMAEDIENYKALGFADHCAKPINRRELIDKIRYYMETTQSSNHEQQAHINSDAYTALQAEFKNKLIDHADVLITLLSVNNQAEIAKLAHQIHGAAASFGFTEIGYKAAEIEQLFMQKNRNESFANTVLDLVKMLKATV